MKNDLMPQAKFAILREVPDSYAQCLSTWQGDPIRVGHARRQHKAYAKAIANLGVEVTMLPADPDHPDSLYVEDNAMVFGDLAVISNQAVTARQGESREVREILGSRMKVEEILAPGFLDGGDVLLIGKKIFVGLTERTNREAADQLAMIMNERGYTVHMVPVHDILHLKSVVTYLGRDMVMVTEGHFSLDHFSDFLILKTPPGENYAANCLSLNGTVMVARGFPGTRDLLRKAGFSTLELDVSEFQKGDGSLTCPSILYG